MRGVEHWKGGAAMDGWVGVEYTREVLARRGGASLAYQRNWNKWVCLLSATQDYWPGENIESKRDMLIHIVVVENLPNLASPSRWTSWSLDGIVGGCQSSAQTSASGNGAHQV